MLHFAVLRNGGTRSLSWENGDHCFLHFIIIGLYSLFVLAPEAEIGILLSVVSQRSAAEDSVYFYVLLIETSSLFSGQGRIWSRQPQVFHQEKLQEFWCHRLCLRDRWIRPHQRRGWKAGSQLVLQDSRLQEERSWVILPQAAQWWRLGPRRLWQHHTSPP